MAMVVPIGMIARRTPLNPAMNVTQNAKISIERAKPRTFINMTATIMLPATPNARP